MILHKIPAKQSTMTAMEMSFSTFLWMGAIISTSIFVWNQLCFHGNFLFETDRGSFGHVHVKKNENVCKHYFNVFSVKTDWFIMSFIPETDSEDELPVGWEERATLDGKVFYAK